MIDRHIVKVAVAAVCIIVAAVLFWDWIAEHVIELLTFGALGGGAVAAKKKQASKAKIIADEHEDLMQHDLDAANRVANEGADAHQNAVNIAEDATDPNYNNLPPGFKPKSIKSR